MAGALIVTVDIGQSDFAWIDGLRRAHYPPERNHVPAHLLMFHALPPSAEPELRARLSASVRRPVPRATIAGLLDLGGGVAFRLVSDELDAMREDLATELHGLLGAKDSGGWRPHITIQNKVAPSEARRLKALLERDFRPRAIAISGLGLQRYDERAWTRLGTYSFRL